MMFYRSTDPSNKTPVPLMDYILNVVSVLCWLHLLFIFFITVQIMHHWIYMWQLDVAKNYVILWSMKWIGYCDSYIMFNNGMMSW